MPHMHRHLSTRPTCSPSPSSGARGRWVLWRQTWDCSPHSSPRLPGKLDFLSQNCGLCSGPSCRLLLLSEKWDQGRGITGCRATRHCSTGRLCPHKGANTGQEAQRPWLHAQPLVWGSSNNPFPAFAKHSLL